MGVGENGKERLETGEPVGFRVKKVNPRAARLKDLNGEHAGAYEKCSVAPACVVNFFHPTLEST